MSDETREHTLEARILGRYLVRPPATGSSPPLLIGFHGYGESAQQHLEELTRIPGADAWLLVSVQGLHRFYERKSGRVVASWMTSQDRLAMIEHNVAYVDAVVEEVRARYTSTGPLVFSGFSQGVAMAYRAATRGVTRPAGLVALAGDVPPELQEQEDLQWPDVVLGRGADDTLYSQERMNEDLAFLTTTGCRVERVIFEGGHHWHDEFRHAAGRMLETIRSLPAWPPHST